MNPRTASVYSAAIAPEEIENANKLADVLMMALSYAHDNFRPKPTQQEELIALGRVLVELGALAAHSVGSIVGHPVTADEGLATLILNAANNLGHDPVEMMHD